MLNRSNTQHKSTTKMVLIRLLLCTITLVTFSCQTESEDVVTNPELNLAIRLGFEPDRINPMLSRQVHASQVEGMIFLPLADYNPITLRLEPILISEPPVISVVDVNGTEGLKYDMTIMDEAVWDDGTPITGYDYEFTMKAALNPYLINTTWKGQMIHITDISINERNPKKITVYTNSKYILSEEVITTNDVYPQHIYDQDQLLKNYSFSNIKDFDPKQEIKLDSVLHQFADQFNNENYSRKIISGAGPYRFVEWIPNQQIVLERKENWWGTKFQDRHPCLEAKPKSITYYLIPDAQTAITALKDLRINLVADLTPEQYKDLQVYNNAHHSLILESPSVLQYFFIAYNNDHVILGDNQVRRGISYLMDIDNLIDKLFFGLAIRTLGPLSPHHEAYNQNLKPLLFNPDEAKRLFTKAGWNDTDNDGILDKMIDGKKIDFKLNILTSRAQLSQDVAIILSGEAEKIGIQFQIIPNDVTQLIGETQKGDFDLSCLAAVQSIGPYDPYNFWHSDNAGPDGTNYCNFRNAEADSLIDKIRITLDSKERIPLYRRFQEIIYEEQPALFLVAPKTPLAATGNLNFTSTPLRPGYFENTISLKD